MGTKWWPILALAMFVGCADGENTGSPYAGNQAIDPNSIGALDAGLPDPSLDGSNGIEGGEGTSSPEPDAETPEPDTESPDTSGEEGGEPECTSNEECPGDGPCQGGECFEGECVLTPLDDVDCDDGDLCTGGDLCDKGVCTGAPLDCDDGNECTNDSCLNGCAHTPVDTPECTLSVEFDYPERGAILYGQPIVPVSGTVVSPVSPVTSVTLNGEELPLDDDGTFTIDVASSIGVNLLRLEASNSAGQSASRSISYGYGDGLHETSTPTQMNRLVSATGAWIGADAFDDGNDDLDDLSSLAALVLDTLDVNSLIPHPLIAEGDGPGLAWCEWEVDIATTGSKAISYDLKDVSVSPVTGGLFIRGELNNFSAWIEAVDDGFLCPDGKGWLSASTVEIEVSGAAEITDNGAVNLEVLNTVVTISGVQIDVEEGLSSLFNWVIDWFEDDLENLIEEELELFIPDEVVPVLETALNEVAYVDESFILPALPGGSELPMTISVVAAGAQFTSAGAELALSGGIGVLPTIAVDSPGSIARGTCGAGGGGINPVVGPIPDGEGAIEGEEGGGTDAKACCAETPDMPGCAYEPCESCICNFDAYCCSTQWDDLCVEEANQEECGDTCGCDVADDSSGGENTNCCGALDGKGCPNSSCESCVCALDSFCCDNAWDANCGGTAAINCAVACGCNSSNAVVPTAAGSCQDECGNKSGDCWCDALCVQNGDCCDDACGFCGYCPGEELVPSGDTGEFEFSKVDPIEVRIHEDMLNHILHGAWLAEYLNLDLEPAVFEETISFLGASDMEMTVFPLMPPMVTSCTDDGELEVHLGAILCDATFQFNGLPATFKLYASIQTEIEIKVVDNSGPQAELGVMIKELEAYQVDVLEIEGLGGIGPDLLEVVLTEALVQLLVADVINNLIATYPVPTLDLSTLISTLPLGTLMTGDFTQVGWKAGHFHAGGVIYSTDQ